MWDGGPSCGRVGEQPLDADTGAERDTTLGDSGAANDPLEGGAAAGKHHQFVVFRLALEVDNGRRQVVAEAHLCRAFGQQLGVYIWILVAQEADQLRQERMAVAHLRSAATVPVERFIGRRWHRGVVTLDHRHPVAIARQNQRRTQP